LYNEPLVNLQSGGRECSDQSTTKSPFVSININMTGSDNQNEVYVNKVTSVNTTLWLDLKTLTVSEVTGRTKMIVLSFSKTKDSGSNGTVIKSADHVSKVKCNNSTTW